MLENGLFSVSGNNIKKDFELLTRALDAAIPGIIITDNIQPDNPIIYCNAAFEKMTGYDRKEIIGRNCRFLQNQDRNQPASQAIRNAVQTGKSCVVEMRNYKKNGTLFWNELFISPVFNTEGEVAYFIAVQNDISISKKAALSVIQYQAEMEAKVKERTRLLKESEEYLQSIIHTIRECLIVLDPDLNVLDVNEHFLKTFKVSRQETRGRTLYELGNGQWNIPRLKDLLENILPSNNPVVEFEVEHEFPHIGKKLMLLNAHRIELEGQFKNQILIAIEDITDRRQIERRKDDFLSIASHELRTPLTTIKGYVQIMDRLMPENAGEKFRNVVAKTALYVDRLNNLIAELLDVSRIQTGNIELHKKTFDFDKMALETVENIQSASKNHVIKVEGATNSIYNGDESHIVQVINNLLSNAIKYSPGNNEISLHMARVADCIKVSVTDRGMGISSEEQKRIFERFYRVSDVQQKFPGMGIGLYVCEQIIKNHGGILWVESEKGKGARFSFTLPLNNRIP